MKKNVVVNYLYNMVYQVINIGAPIIVIPYIARVIGAEGIGMYDYTYSFASLFVALGMFGINNYGSKTIAKVRDKEENVKASFWSIWSLQAVANLSCIAIYLFTFVFMDVLDLKILFIMQFPMLLTALFDISWLFIGLEDFKKTVTRNVIVKLAGLILVFLLVNKPSDLWIYAVVISLSGTIGNMSFWLFIPKYIKNPKLSYFNFVKHINGSFMLLIPFIANYIYMAVDRIVIGNLVGDVQLAYYTNSMKVALMPIVAITSLTQVMMPTIANLHANNNKELINEYIAKSVKFSALFSVFISFALMAVSEDFVPMFFGDEFLPIIPYMMLSSVIGIFICIGGVFANSYSLPIGQKLGYALPLTIAVIVNPILNFLLVPKLLALGGVIAKVITEVIIFATRIFVVRKELDLKIYFKGMYKYILSGIIACLATIWVSKFFTSSFINVMIEGIVCLVVYMTLVLLLDKDIRKIGKVFLIKIKLIKGR